MEEIKKKETGLWKRFDWVSISEHWRNKNTPYDAESNEK
jgi:hypothetical protein